MIATQPKRPIEIRLANDVVEQIVARHKIHPWFAYIHKERATRWDVWKSCHWIAERVPPSASILETGCGCGYNMIWFAQQGFTDLGGFDIDPAVIAAARDCAAATGVAIEYWTDDGLAPARLGGKNKKYDVVTALNWTVCIPGFDLPEMLRVYRRHLQDGGYLLIDVIDSSFDKVANNQYLTSDWTKPESQRKPTEYPERFSKVDMHLAADGAAFDVVDTISEKQIVPRVIYALRARQIGPRQREAAV